MKKRNLFLTGLISLAMLNSCSNEESFEVAQQGDNTFSQLAIKVASANTATRSTGHEEYGVDSEYTIQDVAVIFANAGDVVTNVLNPLMKTATNVDDADKLIRVTEPFQSPKGDFKVYVIANYKASGMAAIPVGTNMKSVYNLVDDAAIANLSKTDAFVMANVTAPTSTTITEVGNNEEVNDDGSKTTNGKKLTLISVDIERVVSKVTFTGQGDTKTFDVKNEANEVIANTELLGVSLINLNKSMFIVKDNNMAVNKPTGISTWVYPKDNNYTTTLSNFTVDAELQSWLEGNFAQREATKFGDFTSTFYCPENTMVAAAQENGQTTGVVYQVKYTPEDATYSKLLNGGTDPYSAKFTAVIALGGESSITASMFDAKDADGSFYVYNDLIFGTLNAARLFKAIATNSSDATAATILDSYKGDTAPTDIYTYAAGVSYYTAWIKHNPNGGYMEQDKYGVVRNHWYDLKVTGIKRLGYHKPTYEDPKTPDDKSEVWIQVEAKIKQWMHVVQEVELD